jgi:hypothetical protein
MAIPTIPHCLKGHENKWPLWAATSINRKVLVKHGLQEQNPIATKCARNWNGLLGASAKFLKGILILDAFKIYYM